jgi:ribosome assembly protein RRB1
MPKRAKRSSSGDDGGRSVTQRASSASTASTEAEDGLVYADPYGDTFQPEEIVESDDALARLARLTGAAEAAAAARGGGVATSTGGMTVSMSGGSGGGGGAMEAEDEALTFVDGEGEEDEAERGRVEKGAIWNPATQPLGEDETLDYDSSAYLLYHAMQVQWPCLSFDVLSDQLGGLRTKFPMSMYLVAGTQAPATHAAENKLTVMKLSELNRTEHDEDSENEDWDDVDDDPLLASQSVAHPGAVNRVRSMPQAPHVVATWAAEPAAVHLWDASELIERVDGGAMGGPQTRTLPGAAADATASRPVFSFTEHADEGYAMDWSPVAAGRFATGDCAGQLRVWNMRDGAMDWAVDAPFRAGHTSSVEDVQWSPTEPTVLASCGADAHVRIWDVREPSHPMISVKAHECDVNVLSWNRLVSYLLVSGADDGSFKVWDLRKFQEP